MNNLTTTPRRAEIEARFATARAIGGGDAASRLIFALDATMSRQPTWDTACHLQADMFREAAAIGGLEVQLVYFRGDGECRASRWVSQPDQLATLMERIDAAAATPRSGRSSPTRSARRGRGRWCSSATPWRSGSTTFAQAAARVSFLARA